jgi:peptide chain release factor 1
VFDCPQAVKSSYPEKEFKIERYVGQGPGGQHRNKNATAVKITHIPTGISASSNMKSQHRNKDAAMKVVLSKLSQGVEKKSKDSQKKIVKDQIRQMSRGDKKIRTYNFIESVVRDERAGKPVKINKFMKGDLGLVYKQCK